MTWTCCDETHPDDLKTCPQCGQRKGQWTIKFDRTRQFKIGAKNWLELELVDEDGRPVAGRAYEVRLPKTGEMRRGELDAEGRLRIDGISKGTCEVWFPEPSEEEGDWIELEVALEAGGAAAGEPYELTVGDGSVRSGTLDAAGKLRLEGLPSGPCQLRFPERE